MNLTVQFFLVYLVHWCLVTLRQMGLALLRPFLKAALPVSQAACETVLLCPVLAALFLAVRTRSIELQRSPPEYAQQAMFLATYAVMLQLVMVLLLPLLSGEQLVADPRRRRRAR